MINCNTINYYKYFILILLFLSCNTNNTEKDIIGKWEIDKIYFDADSLNTKANLDPLIDLIENYKKNGYYLEFKKVKYFSSFRTVTKGNWIIKNNLLHLQNDEEVDKLEILELDEKKLILIIDGMITEYSKKTFR